MEKEYYKAEMRSIRRSKRWGCLATGLIVMALLIGGSFATVRFGPRLAVRAIFSDEMAWTSEEHDREEVQREINDAIDSLDEYGITRDELKALVMDIEPEELSAYVQDLKREPPTNGTQLLIPMGKYIDLSGVDRDALAAEFDKRVDFEQMNRELQDFDGGEVYAFRFAVPMAQEVLLEILEQSRHSVP
jgi:hypothetical protein